MLLFRDEEHVDRWCEAHDVARGETISCERAWRLAQGWYGKKLKPDWRRHTPAETKVLLDSLGLTSQFWQVT